MINNLSILRNFRFCQPKAFRFVLFRGTECVWYRGLRNLCLGRENENSLIVRFYTCLARVSWAVCNWHAR